MIAPARRTLLFSLLALTMTPGRGVAQAATPIPARLKPGLQRLRDAYVAANPTLADAKVLARDLMPNGWNAEAEVRLRERIAADFRAGRLFLFRGWRLADTEGRLYVVLAS